MGASLTSDSEHQYICLQFAEYSRDKGVAGAAEVVEYLKTGSSAIQTDMTDWTMVACPPRCSGLDAEKCADWKMHAPKKNQHYD